MNEPLSAGRRQPGLITLSFTSCLCVAYLGNICHQDAKNTTLILPWECVRSAVMIRWWYISKYQLFTSQDGGFNVLADHVYALILRSCKLQYEFRAGPGDAEEVNTVYYNSVKSLRKGYVDMNCGAQPKLFCKFKVKWC